MVFGTGQMRWFHVQSEIKLACREGGIYLLSIYLMNKDSFCSFIHSFSSRRNEARKERTNERKMERNFLPLTQRLVIPAKNFYSGHVFSLFFIEYVDYLTYPKHTGHEKYQTVIIIMVQGWKRRGWSLLLDVDEAVDGKLKVAGRKGGRIRMSEKINT